MCLAPRAGGRAEQVFILARAPLKDVTRTENRMILKSLCGGSAVCALLLTSLTFYARPSLAEPLSSATQETKAEIKLNESPLGTPQDAGPPKVAAVVSSLRRDMPVKVSPGLNAPAERLSSVEKEKTAAAPLAAAQVFVATAYALRGRTASGQFVRRGLIATDRNVLPLGTRVRLQAGSYSGEYLVADRGSAVRGRKIDIWMPSNAEAMRFGKRKVKLTILSYGGRRPRRA